VAGVVSLLKRELGLDKTMQGFFDFTEQTEIVKREKRKHLEARQDWQRAPKIIVTEEYIALDKKLEPIEEELFELIKKMPLAIEKKIKGKICVIPSGLKTDEELLCRVRELRKQASKIGKELDELFFKTNHEWAKFYEYTDKT
jgi:hypothetical protein